MSHPGLPCARGKLTTVVSLLECVCSPGLQELSAFLKSKANNVQQPFNEAMNLQLTGRCQLSSNNHGTLLV